MRTDTKTHTDISVTDNSTDVTVYAPDPQIRQNYDAFVKYIRDLELKMRGYDTNEDTGPKPIASYRTAGKTNEDTDRDVLKDLTGNGHNIVLKNFGFTPGSGYEDGALVFDGVDDYGICENFPILTREQGYTLVAKRIYFEKKESSCFLSNRTGNLPNNNAFNMEITIRSRYGTRSFSSITQNVLSYPDLLTYQTTKQFNDTMITTKEQNEIGTNTVYLGTLGNGLEYIFNGAFYALDIYDRTLEGEELQTALNNIEK